MKKFDAGYVKYSLVGSLVSSAVILAMLISWSDESEWLLANIATAWPFLVSAYAVIYAVQVAYAWLYVKTSGYELTDAELRCKRGVLFRKSSVLAYGNVHAVNKKQGLIQRLFGIAVLTVDSGSTGNAFSAEITIIERDTVVDAMMREIKRRQEGLPPETGDAATEVGAEPENLYRFTSKLKVMYSVMTVCASVLFLAVLVVLAVIGVAIAQAALRNIGNTVEDLLVGTLFLSGIALLLLVIVSFIGGVVSSFVAYHDFRVHKTDSDIEISYGLFVRHTNHFHIRRIRAVKLHEGPIKRLFGYVSAGLEVIGYGAESNGSDNQNNNAAPGLLLPLCTAKALDETLQAIVPEYVPDTVSERAKSYFAFILWPMLGTTVGFAGVGATALAVLLACGVPSGVSGVIALILAAALFTVYGCIAVCGALQYAQAGLAIGDGKLTLRNGVFVRHRTVIQARDVVAIENITTPCREKRGIYSYKIHFFTNALTNTVQVHGVDAALAEQLEALMKY